ncbi:unnamed protein product, partial [Heterotrigona itama]
YSSSVREPGYDAPAFVEELYCGPARLANNSCYYHQPIYEDEVPDYVAPFPVYAPLSDMPEYRSRHEYPTMEQEKYMVQIIPPPHLDLNTYGHLKIDYTNSWNSLNRKISK